MHQYLKAIGFKKAKSKKDIIDLLKEVETSFTHKVLVSHNEETKYCEFQKLFGDNIGITICGEMDEEETFEMEYYFPYFQGSHATMCAEIIIERRIDKEQYVGIYEDSAVGISLIFTIGNGIESIEECQLGVTSKVPVNVTFSGLAISGKILLPVKKSSEQKWMEQRESDNRKYLINLARNGDSQAMETLTLEDMEMYSKVSKRLITEDVFSIVDSYFMPHGVECDVYSILGEILEVDKIQNHATQEELYRMTLDVNELVFDICVPVSEVMGEPKAGRRFKGDIWLQGYIDF